jgi:hypothetical protein
LPPAEVQTGFQIGAYLAIGADVAPDQRSEAAPVGSGEPVGPRWLVEISPPLP